MPASATCWSTPARITVFCLTVLLAGCDPLSLASLFDSPAIGRSVLTLLETDGRKLRMGDDVQGALSASDFVGLNESYLEAWALEGEAGQTYSIDLLSDDFDSYLQVLGPGLQDPLANDDGGEGLNARLEVRFPADGMYRVVASPLSTGLGTYTLRVH